MSEFLFWIILAFLVGTFFVPWVVYLCVKIGTYAYFRGRELFLEGSCKKEREKHEG